MTGGEVVTEGRDHLSEEGDCPSLVDVEMRDADAETRHPRKSAKGRTSLGPGQRPLSAVPRERAMSALQRLPRVLAARSSRACPFAGLPNAAPKAFQDLVPHFTCVR